MISCIARHRQKSDGQHCAPLVVYQDSGHPSELRGFRCSRHAHCDLAITALVTGLSEALGPDIHFDAMYVIQGGRRISVSDDILSWLTNISRANGGLVRSYNFLLG